MVSDASASLRPWWGWRALGRPGVWLQKRWLWTLFLGFALIYLMLIPPGIIVIDGISQFSVADSLGRGLHLFVPCAASGYDALPHLPSNEASVIGRGGHCYSLWYPLISFAAAPFAGLGEGLGHLTGQRGQNVAQVLVLIVPALATAGAATLTASLSVKLGASRRGAVAAAVAFGFGTEALTYSRSFFAEPLAALLVALGVWGLTESGRRRYWGYLGLALAVLAKPQLILVGPALGALLILQRRRAQGSGAEPFFRSLRPFWGPALATACGFAAYLLYNWARFADPLRFGGVPRAFVAHNFISPAAIGRALGIYLVSPGKGLIWYSPVAALAIVALWRRRRDPLAALCILASLAILIFYIGQYDPYGGDEWGDRYLLPALPLLCAALGTLRPHLAKWAAVLVVIGVASQVPTTVGFYDRTYAEHRDQGVNLPDHRWSVARSPLVTSWPAMVHQIRDAADTDVRRLGHLAGATGPRTSVRDTQLLHVVALWWWLLPILGIPWWVGALFAAGVIAAGARLLFRSAQPRAGPPYAGPEPAARTVDGGGLAASELLTAAVAGPKEVP